MTDAELDIEDRAQLQRYLEANFSPAEEFAIVEFEVLAGGVSGRTVRVKLAGGQEWVLKQALAKLRVKADWFSNPRRIHREALGMKVLGELTPPGSIPKLIFDDERHHVLGMEAVPQPHENWKAMLLSGRGISFVSQFGELLAKVHRRSAKRSSEISIAFDDRSYFESLRLEPYYVYGAENEPRAKDFFLQLVTTTRETRVALVHGDFSPKNILVHKNRLVLLDHEVIHWGDPAFDVGFGLSHLLSKVHHLQRARADLVVATRSFWDAYHLNTLPSESNFVFPYSMKQCVNHTLGCLLARIVGRSPLEYLTPEERDRQREAVVRLIQDVPRDVPEMISRFTQEIESRE